MILSGHNVEMELDKYRSICSQNLTCPDFRDGECYLGHDGPGALSCLRPPTLLEESIVESHDHRTAFRLGVARFGRWQFPALSL
jgi:hypothetical protein